AGRADDRGHHALVDLEAHVADRRRVAIERRQALDAEDRIARERRGRGLDADHRGVDGAREPRPLWGVLEADRRSVVRHRSPFMRRMLRSANQRAIKLATRMIPIRTAAAPHACWWRIGSACSAEVKMNIGIDASGWRGS